MANKFIQNMMNRYKGIINRHFGVCDNANMVISSTDLMDIGSLKRLPEFSSENDVVSRNGYTYKPVYVSSRLEYVVFCEGVDDEAVKDCSAFAIMISTVKQFHDEKYDKASFIKNLVMDNILPSDVHWKSKELHLQNEAPRVAFLIRCQDFNEVSVFDVLKGLFPEKNKDFVISIDEKDIALVKQVDIESEPKDFEKIAKSIEDTVQTEALTSVLIGIGTKALDIKDVSRSYKEAQIALEVGKVFDTEKSIVNYESLGIGRLIYQLPKKLCNIFMSEVFKKGSIDVLDQETIITIQKFFENNLNVSETARKLFVHRNTLVYRLDKIKKLTGLDLRYFDQAIVFKVAMMVNKYMNSGSMTI